MDGAGSTYSPDLIGEGGKDWVRFKIGDRDVPDKTVYCDAEINAMLVLGPNRWFAAAELAESLLASNTGGAVEKAVGDLRIRWSDSPHSAYRELIDNLRETGAEELQGSQGAFVTLGTATGA